MTYNIRTVKTLITDNGKSFRVGDDIAFTLYNTTSRYNDHYIGEIVDITDTSIKIKNIEIDRDHIDGEMVIKLNGIRPNSCNYVYSD